jgi:hypothetical protein
MPKRHLKTLADFLSLSNKQKDNYLHLLDSISPEFSKKELQGNVNLFDKDFDKFLSYLRFFVSLNLNFLRFGKSLNLFVEEVIIESAKKYDIHLEPIDKIRELIDKIKKMDENIGILAKSISLLTENPKIFYDGRIVTDLRYLFYNDIERIPNYALIQHLLRLNYIKNGETKEIFLNLNLDQLIELKNTIDRAIKKEDTIKKLCKEKDIIYLKEVEWFE